MYYYAYIVIFIRLLPAYISATFASRTEIMKMI